MANTYTLISSVTVGSGGASSIDFTSIPSTYTDLVIKFSARDANAAVWDNLLMTFNNTGTNFSWRVLGGFGSGSGYSTSGSGGTTGNQFSGESTGANATASTFGNAEIYIPNYAGSNYKSFSVDSVTENNATLVFQSMVAGLWSNTAAITSLKISVGTGVSFNQYSNFYLYGIKNS